MEGIPYEIIVPILGWALGLVGFDRGRAWLRKRGVATAQKIENIARAALALIGTTPSVITIESDVEFNRQIEALIAKAALRMGFKLSSAEVMLTRRAITTELVAMHFSRLEREGARAHDNLRKIRDRLIAGGD